MAPPTKPELNARDQAALKTISKLYDEKKYKKGLKQVDTFLKHHPENVDGLCFKSLIVYSMNNKVEAHNIAKQVLRSNLSSSMAWHTLGYLHKSDKNYTEALKSFRNACKHNKENLQILKDLLSVQLYTRDIPGLKETYATLLQAQPAQKGNWVGLILSYHLLGNYKQALVVMDNFINDVLEEKERSGVSYSELVLYKCMILEESGDLDQVLKILREQDKIIVDKTWSRKKQAEILLKKNEIAKAEKIYLDMIKINPDDYTIHKKLIESRGVSDLENLSTDNDIKVIGELYNSLKSQYPKSLLIQRLPLTFTKAEDSSFEKDLFEYIKQFLKKGIPSLFNNLKNLYKDSKKVEIIEKLFTREMQSLKESSKFTDSTSDQDEKEIPSTYLWCVYYLAQHFDKLANYEKAIQLINQIISHTPTCIDLYVVKAKILKHQGDVQGAFTEYNYARGLDLADRYLNTKAAKYALRNNDPLTADQIVSLVKDDRTPLVDTISEFQCMWYEQELGDAYQRSGDYGRSLKNYYLVDKHFNEFLEDQFDFHHHIQKKLTLRSYVEFLRWEDKVFQNKPYTKAAKQLINCYIKLINQQTTTTSTTKITSQNQLKNKEDLEKSLKEHREAQEKLRNESKSNAEGQPIVLDEDQNGDALIGDSKLFLPAVNKFLDNLLKFNSESVDTQVLASEIYLQEKKYQLALKSIKKIKELGCDLKYHQYLMKLYSSSSPISDESVESERSSLFGGKSLVEYNQEFLNKNSNSIKHRFIALTSIPSTESTLESLMNLNGEGSWKDAVEVYQYIFNNYSIEISEKYRELCNKKYPFANSFQLNDTKTTTTPPPPQEQQQQEQEQNNNK